MGRGRCQNDIRWHQETVQRTDEAQQQPQEFVVQYGYQDEAPDVQRQNAMFGKSLLPMLCVSLYPLALKHTKKRQTNAPLTQMEEYLTFNQKVRGSIPRRRTKVLCIQSIEIPADFAAAW